LYASGQFRGLYFSRMSDTQLPRKTIILLVEDEVLVRGLIRSALATEGYEVLDAGNGREALDLSRAHPGPIHLMLTDIHMPLMDGLSLVKVVAEERPDTRILVMTGYSTIRIPPALLPQLIPKPFNTTDLLSRIALELDAG